MSSSFFNSVFYSITGAILGNYIGVFYYNYCFFFKKDFLLNNNYSIFDYSYYSTIVGSLSFYLFYNIKNRI